MPDPILFNPSINDLFFFIETASIIVTRNEKVFPFLVTFFFYLDFSFTAIHESQDCRKKRGEGETFL